MDCPIHPHLKKLYDLCLSQSRRTGAPSVSSEVGSDYLSDAETDLIGQCLRAAVDGPFFPEWEFNSLMGLQRAEVVEVADEWPSTSDATRQRLAIGNVLNNLLGYPVELQEWPSYISYSRDEVASAFSHWGDGAEPRLNT